MTASDYGVLADLGGTVDYDAEATATTVMRGLGVAARETSGGRRSDVAGASTRIQRAGSSRGGQGVTVSEHGFVRNADPAQSAAAGTSADAPSTQSPSQGGHSLSVNYPNIGQGMNAIVTIRWRGNASAGASCAAAVDVDGDGNADFMGTANGTPVATTLQVTAGTNGVTIDITTNGSAAVAADGRESYAGALTVLVEEGTLPTSCTFTNFGTACGADLNGSVSPNLDLTLDVSNAAPDAYGFMLLGDQLATPMPAPIGNCNILVDRRGWGRGSFRMFRTDSNGDATVNVPTPNMALTVSFQALVLTRDPATRTRSLDASNGTELACQ